MNDVLFAPLSNYIEGVVSKLTSISNKAISRIKADSFCSPRTSEAMKRQDGA